ncbi:MAG: sigma-54-dependent transcriptional regulator [bacterium]
MQREAKTILDKGSILLIEDEHHLRQGLADLLKRHGFGIQAAANGAKALRYLQESSVDLILTDMKMKGVSELSLIDALIKHAPHAQIIVMTAYATVKEAVETMKRGVYDYLTKPLNIDELILCLNKALEKNRLVQEVAALRQELQSRYGLGNIVGKSRKMQEMYDKIRKVAPTDATVLILGETGTGKELVAKAIHFNSPRRDARFITLASTSIPESLLASELFGHEKGAFTGAYSRTSGKFEAADKGTLFIDDVTELDATIQVSLLRFLQDKEFERVGGNETIEADVRIIAASNKDLFEEVKRQNFREDLYYRLNVVPIYMPPLRERKEDIPLLADHFAGKYSNQTQKSIKGLTTGAMLLLMSYSWPGNVRELEHLVERAVIMAEGPWIDTAQLLPHVSPAESLLTESAFGANLLLSDNFKCLEKHLIARALEEAHGNRTKAAEMLGITYRGLRYKMKKYGYD